MSESTERSVSDGELVGPTIDDTAVCSKAGEVEPPPVVTAPEVDALQLPPNFLHPSSIFFEAAAQIRQMIVPVLFGLVGAASGNAWGVGVALLAICLSIVFNLIRFLTLRYRIEDREFVVTEGLLFRRIRSVPTRRIQNIDYVQNLLHRFFDVAVVNVETASGSKPEATLRVITMRQVEQLRAAVFRGTCSAPLELNDTSGRGVGSEAEAQSVLAESRLALGPAVARDSVGETEAAGPKAARQLVSQRRTLWRIAPHLLFIAGMTSNRGMVLLGIVAGAFFQGGWESRRNWRISTEELYGYVPGWFSSWPAAWQIVVTVILVLLLLRVVSVVWYFLRFYGYVLSIHGEDLRISCGLFTKVNATIPRERIQFISVHRPWLMRYFGLASMRIETAGGSGTGNEDAAATVGRRWFIPVLPESLAFTLLLELRPNIDWDLAGLQWRGLSPRAGSRMLRQALALSVIVAIIGLAVTRPWGWAAGLILLPGLIWYSQKKAKARRYARPDWGVVFQSGLLTRKTSFTFLDRIQTIDISQSIFDRRWKMATLRIDTAAAGPAEHLIDVAYLDADFAKHEFRSLCSQAARHRPEFG